VNVTKVTCRGCHHVRWSESLHNQNKSWFFVNNWEGCEIRVSGIIPLGLGRTGMQTTEIRRLQDNLKTVPSPRHTDKHAKDVAIY